jgi:hypothetical protein
VSASEATTNPAATPFVRDPLPRAGWRVVAAKELGAHLASVRFVVL